MEGKTNGRLPHQPGKRQMKSVQPKSQVRVTKDDLKVGVPLFSLSLPCCKMALAWNRLDKI